MSKAKFNWAILGTGPVSQKFLLGLHAAPGHRVGVVASRDPNNATRFARSFGITAASYEEAVARPDIDAVYIATPPALHETHALMALMAGKAVLIEKPFAMDRAAASRIRETARATGAFCMEAMWTRFQPLPQKIRDMAQARHMGELRGFYGEFCGADIPDTESSLYDPARGGGALMHRGVYPLSLALYFLGPIRDMTATGRIGETGVDEDCTLVLTHENGAISTLRASLRSSGSNGACLYGTKGRIEIGGPIYRPNGARLVTTTARPAGTGTTPGRAEKIKESGALQGLNQWLGPLRTRVRPPGRALRTPFAGNGYGHEAMAAAEAIRAGAYEHPLMPLDESLSIMALIDQAKAAFGR